MPPTFAAAAQDNIWLAEISRNSINITPISTCFTKNARGERGPVVTKSIAEKLSLSRALSSRRLSLPRPFPRRHFLSFLVFTISDDNDRSDSFAEGKKGAVLNASSARQRR
ncbi:unnamed protein product [Lasius platythorax]|uniref:Uncharacterized protein n=1 Tax=Lasius platythorax TaxID=488582 RepID=A0AAV2N5T9_9HYME